MTRALYYDRDPAWREQAERWLSRDGAIEVVPAGTFDGAVARYREREFDAVVADPLDEEVLGLLSIVRARGSSVPFVLFMEAGHEGIVIDAFNSGVDRYVEKGASPEDRLDALGRTVEGLVHPEPDSASLHRQNELLEFLSRTAMDFIRMEDEEDIYRYIGDQVHGLVPDSSIILFSIDPDVRRLVVRAILPEEPARRVAREELGKDLVGHAMSLDTAPASLMKATLGCNQMVEGVTSAYFGFLKTLPEAACTQIELRLDLGKYYSMGCTCRGGLYGVVTIAVRKGTELGNRELIEAFVRQASVALLRRQARQNLARSEARYRAVVESQQELICRFRPDGTHLVANEAYCRFFGLDPATIPGSRFVPLLLDDDVDRVGAYFRSFSSARPDRTLEHRVVLPDERVRWLQWSDRAFFNRDGAIVEFQSVGHDITERKEAETRLAALTAELEQRVEERTAELRAANRDLESFTYTVSHDLRAPLRAIDGYASILAHEHRSGLPASAVRYLDQIIQGARRMGRLIDDLLAFSRAGRQALAVRAMDPAVFVAEVLDDLAGEREGREVRITVGGLARCSADPALVKQVFANLVGNALKFTRTRSVAEIAIWSGDEGGRPVYSVRDNGVGFPPEHAAAIFDSFARFHDAREYEGSGIGLSLVRRIVERHGGRVWAESVPGEGSTFFFTLPAA